MPNDAFDIALNSPYAEQDPMSPLRPLLTPIRPLAATVYSVLLAALTACGGGGGGSSCALPACGSGSSVPIASEPASTAPPSTPTPTETSEPDVPQLPSYAIGGTLTGLAENTTLVLLNNGVDALTLAANGTFRFAVPVALNVGYAVTVGTHPLWQKCSVTRGSGAASSGVTDVQVNCIEAEAQVTTFAGSTTAGAADGDGTIASFNTPQAIAIDADGNIYVADTYNHLIRKITAAGVVTTLAGSKTPGSANGTGTSAQFNEPDGVAVDANGNIYVADSINNQIRKITPTGVVTTLAGSIAPGSADGSGVAAQFNGPGGLAVDKQGNVYVADIGNHAIRKITPAGVVTTLAGSTTAGSADGNGAAAQFTGPGAVAVDASGNIYVADSSNHEIRKITPSGTVTTFAGTTTAGADDGSGGAARFNLPLGIAIDARGHVYVADAANNKIRRITPPGLVTTLAGSSTRGSADGIGATAQFAWPYDVAVDVNGDLYVVSGNQIRKITPVR